MIKNIIILIAFVIFPLSINADPRVDRLSVSKKLTEMAKKNEVKIEFSVDPNDDTTLLLYRASSLAPKELSGDWTMYLFSTGTTKEDLKDKGFTKVRIYTSKSKDITDYVLKIL